MSITLDWQIELPARSLLLGAGTDYPVLTDPAPPPVGFVGAAVVASSDVPTLRDGAAFGLDRYEPGLLQFTIGCDGSSASNVRQLSDLLRVGWRKATEDVQLDVRLPGAPETVLSYFGRPRGFAEANGTWSYFDGWLATDLEFHNPDAQAYGALQTTTQSAGTFTIPAANMGHAGTRTVRALIAIDANGGTPVITLAATDADGVAIERDITFTSAVSSDVTLDLYEQTATQVTTDDVIGQTAGSSHWIELIGGVDNVITVAGCTGVTVSWRPAYY